MKTLTPKKLPLSTLDHALSDFVALSTPLLSPSEVDTLQTHVDAFNNEKNRQLANKLHQAYENLPNNENWMADAWKTMYLNIREPLHLDSNYNLHFSLSSPPGEERIRMVQWIQKVIQFYKNQARLPTTVEESGHSICYQGALHLFGTVREPQAQTDQWYTGRQDCQHIGIVRKNRIYTIKVISDNGDIIDQQSLINALNIIATKPKAKTPLFTAVASKGSQHARDFLNRFLAHENNQSSYDAFTQCICHFHLMDKAFTQPTDAYYGSIFHPHYMPWPYMGINFFLWENAQVSVLAEHTGADGAALVYCLKTIQSSSLPDKTTPLHTVKEQTFSYSDNDLKQLQHDMAHYRHQQQQYSPSMVEIPLFFPQTSTEILTQLMFQFGMYSLEKKFYSIYAPCAMNHFKKGRTEALRSISRASTAFIKKLADQDIFDDTLFEQAIGAYKRRIKQAKNGEGSTRYLSALNTLMPPSPNPETLFDSVAFKRLNHNFFSTSNIGKMDDLIDYFYFTPPKGSRVGIGYLTGKKKVRLFIITEEKNDRYLERLTYAFQVFSMRLMLRNRHHPTHSSND